MATNTKKQPATAITATVETPAVDEKALQKQSTDIQTRVTALVVKDQVSYNSAAAELATVKQFIKYLEGIFAPAKKALKVAMDNLKTEEKKLVGSRLEVAEGLEKTLKGKMSKFLIDEERRIAEEKRKAQEEADREAEAERKKLEKQAAKAEEKGKDDKAEELRGKAAAVTAAPVSVAPSVSLTGTGTTGRDDIQYEITDLRLFLRYVLDSGEKDVSSIFELRVKGTKDFVKKNIPADEKGNRNAPGIIAYKTKIISV